jgi:hypothetical protein
MTHLGEYYANPRIRARMTEFLGGETPDTVTCRFLTAGDSHESNLHNPYPPRELESLWQACREINRSLWDSRSLIVHLDVEYVNFDHPITPYLNPERIFDLQRPVEWVVEAVLLDYGIVPLHLLSGRGHHFVWRIENASPVFRRIAQFGRVPPSLQAFYKRPHPPEGTPVPEEWGAAYAGLALVMEYVAHRIQELAAPMCTIPVELTAVEVGPTTSASGREMISIDISEYGDPLNSRVIRVPYSLYLKPWQQRDWLGSDQVAQLPPVFAIPLHEMDSRLGIQVMHNLEAVVDLARRSSVIIPDQTAAMDRLIEAYRQSPLARFHDWFYQKPPEPPEDWPDTYDRVSSSPLPGCIRHLLEQPNDLLLRPGQLRLLTRVLLALGWHPHDISGLVQSKFARDYGWGQQWDDYDPAARADFYIRVFAGLFVVGRDDLIGFNWPTAREQKIWRPAG